MRAVSLVGHCTILACPGSGKTRVLSERAARLLSVHEKGRLCAVTFTRDAAEDLGARILASIGAGHGRRLAVGTFHSLALGQIKRAMGRRMARLLSEGERLAVLRRCWKQHGPEHSFDDVVQAVDAARARVSAPVFLDPSLESVYRSYQDVMKSEGAMDFSDLIQVSVQAMASGDMAPLPVRWLLVDEAQDMDEVQMEWVLHHGRAGTEVTLVGDDDQSLYAFRHALGYEGLQAVTHALASSETTLPVNYRCAPNILAAAAKLIARNKNRAAKQIAAHRTDSGEIRLFKAADRWGEIEDALRIIGRAERTGGWAVLGRTNSLLDAVEAAISDAGIPYARSGGRSVWEHSVGSVFLGLLRTTHDASWTGVANTLSFCGIRAARVNGHSIQTTGNTLDRLARIIEQTPEDDPTRVTLVRLGMGLTGWMSQAKKGRPALAIHGVTSFLADYCKPKQLDLLHRLSSAIQKLSGSLAQRLTAVTRDRPRGVAEGVQVMTLHASKGLEFDNVWIMGLEEGSLPHVDAHEEDERRLLYVGMTRARHRLILSSAVEEGPASRFLEEAGIS